MAYSLTIFKSIFDNKTHRRMDFESFDVFETVMRGLQKKVKRKFIFIYKYILYNKFTKK